MSWTFPQPEPPKKPKKPPRWYTDKPDAAIIQLARRRSFKSGDLVRRRDNPELVGQVMIPARTDDRFLINDWRRHRDMLRVKVIWDWERAGDRADFTWHYEAELMAIDAITELGRLA